MPMNTNGAEDDGKMKVLISTYALDSTMLNKAEKTTKWKPKCRNGYVNQTVNKTTKNHSGQNTRDDNTTLT